MLWLNIDMQQVLGITLNDGMMVVERITKCENPLVSSRWCYWLSFADLIILFPIKTHCIKLH